MNDEPVKERKLSVGRLSMLAELFRDEERKLLLAAKRMKLRAAEMEEMAEILMETDPFWQKLRGGPAFGGRTDADT